MKTAEEYIATKKKYLDLRDKLHAMSEELRTGNKAFTIAIMPIYMKASTHIGDGRFNSPFSAIENSIPAVTFKVEGDYLYMTGYGDKNTFMLKNSYIENIMALVSKEKYKKAVELAYETHENDKKLSDAKSDSEAKTWKLGREIDQMDRTKTTLVDLGLKDNDPSLLLVNDKIEKLRKELEEAHKDRTEIEGYSIAPIAHGGHGVMLKLPSGEIFRNFN